MTRAQKIITAVLPVLLLALYALFLAHPINLMTADLGRHLENGRQLFQNHILVKTNFYSYTYPDFPTTNHHWGSGALFYLVFRLTGFVGLHIFFIILNLIALGLFLAIAPPRKASLTALALVGLLAVPLIAERAEVRPEALTYVFAGAFFLILQKRRRLWLLPLLQILWVNSHLYFFLGPAIVAAFLLEAIIKKDWPWIKKLSLVLAALLASTLINPFFWRGAIAPLAIFKNYGYNLAENQPLWEIERLLPGNPNYLIFKIILGLLVASFCVKFLRDRQNFPYARLCLAAGAAIMGLFMLRNFTIFGLFALPIIAMNFYKEGAKINWPPLAAAALALLLALSGELAPLFPQLQNYKLGLAPGITDAADFFKNNRLRGPVFNNYDIGGYLIYELAPHPSRKGEGVFVDNRPEAYPAEFFQNEYIPMQENEEKWQAAMQKYGFNTIIFWWRDYTPWAQTFLKNRLDDPQWKQVYLDDFAIIFQRSVIPAKAEIQNPTLNPK